LSVQQKEVSHQINGKTQEHKRDSPQAYQIGRHFLLSGCRSVERGAGAGGRGLQIAP
jgi:hypothetical protein